jgi:hypothetical protein
MSMTLSTQLNAQAERDPANISRIYAGRVSEQAAPLNASPNLPSLEDIRLHALWEAIDLIISNYHYYVTPDQLEKLFGIKINDREYSKDGHVTSSYEGRVGADEEIRDPKSAMSVLSLQLENFTPASYVPLWKISRGSRKDAWYSVLNISDSYACRPLGDVEKDLMAHGMKKEAVLTKLYGVVINEHSVYVDPKYDAKVILYYTSSAETDSCVSSVEIVGLGHLKIK